VKIGRTTLLGTAVAIFVATAWLYWPSVRGGFLTRMDDDEYLRQSIRWNGLTWGAVKWAFTATEPYYHPLPRLSHVLDYQIWGRDATGHHATSVVLHALNAALVFGFLWTLLGHAELTDRERFLVACGVAAVFAIHPFQTESVAWMSGRTQLMCTTLGVGCMWVYVAGARRWVVWGLYVGALLCKPMAVAFPFVMLAIDYFPLRRNQKVGWLRLLQEKAVLIGLVIVAAAATVVTELRPGGLMVSLEAVSPVQRVFLLFQSLTFYPWRLICPVGFSPFYPLSPGLQAGWWTVVVPMLSVAVVTGVAVWYRLRIPVLAASWAAYVMLVLPVSGLTQTGMAGVALRYAYVAMLPLLLAMAAGVVWLWRRSATIGHAGLSGLLVCELCVFGLQTRMLIPTWHDNETLWQTAIARYPDAAVPNRVLSMIYLAQRRPLKALDYARRYAAIFPKQCESHNNLGSVLATLGRFDEAIAEFQEALRLQPDYADAHNNLGNALLHEGKVDEAMQHYEEAVKITPGSPEAQYDLGVVLERMGRAAEAAQHYQIALRLRPDLVPARNALARLQASQ